MERYTLSKHYAVSVDTKYRRHKTWSNSVRLIDAAGANGAPESDLLRICRSDADAGCFRYCREEGITYTGIFLMLSPSERNMIYTDRFGRHSGLNGGRS